MIKRLIITTGLFLSFSLLIVPRVYAVNCSSVPISGNYTVSSSCEFANTVDGVDTGTGGSNTASITVNSGVTLTISAGQTVAFGSLTPTGSIVITKTGGGGTLRKIPLWMTDADADNYPSSTTQVAQSTTPTNGRRRNLMTSISTTDCYDSSANAKPTQTSYFTTNRGDGSFDYDCDSAETKNSLYNCLANAAHTCTTATHTTETAGYATTIPACGAAGTFRRWVGGSELCDTGDITVTDDCNTGVTPGGVDHKSFELSRTIGCR